VAELDSRDDQWFEELFRREGEVVYRFMARRLPATDVQDAVAEVFVTVWRCRDEVPAQHSHRAWVLSVATRVASHSRRSAFRRRRLFERASERLPSMAVPDSPAGIDEMRRALATLSKADRLAIELVLWEGLTHAEAAKIVGCSPNALGVRLHRARIKLRTLLETAHKPQSSAAATVTERALRGH
jgi:RNA polymerase sigma factor (sigma-70 family)